MINNFICANINVYLLTSGRKVNVSRYPDGMLQASLHSRGSRTDFEVFP